MRYTDTFWTCSTTVLEVLSAILVYPVIKLMMISMVMPAISGIDCGLMTTCDSIAIISVQSCWLQNALQKRCLLHKHCTIQTSNIYYSVCNIANAELGKGVNLVTHSFHQILTVMPSGMNPEAATQPIAIHML